MYPRSSAIVHHKAAHMQNAIKTFMITSIFNIFSITTKDQLAYKLCDIIKQ